MIGQASGSALNPIAFSLDVYGRDFSDLQTRWNDSLNDSNDYFRSKSPIIFRFTRFLGD